MAYDEKLAARVRALLADRNDVSERNMFGGLMFMVAGGLLWVYAPGGGLNVYVPSSGRLVATLQCGSGHWNSPIVVDGRVALPEGDANHHAQSGVLDIWRLR